MWNNNCNLGAYSVLENAGDIILSAGNNVIGIMIDEENMDVSNGAQHRTINNGKIIINNENSIGIDFGQYGNKLLLADISLGNITVNGMNNYGFRMQNIFDENVAHYDDVTISSGGDNKKIIVAGRNNVGLGVGKSLSSLPTPYTVIGDLNHGTLSGTNPISNFYGINIEITGTNNIGFLRLSNYSTNNTEDFLFNNQTIGKLYINGAEGSTLIRTDKYGIQIKKDIIITGTNGTKNTLAHANGQAQHIYNSGTMKIGSGLTQTTAMASTGTSASTIINVRNTGTIEIDGKESIGMYVDGFTKGQNTGTITMTGTTGNTGVVNKGTFDMQGTVNIKGIKSSGLYNEKTMNIIDNTTINGTAGATGIYANGGTTNLTTGKALTIKVNDTTVSNLSDKGVGIYAKGGQLSM